MSFRIGVAIAFVQLFLGTAMARTDPTGIGSSSTCACGPGGLQLSVTVIPGTLPPSTGIVVQIDLSSIGGSANYTVLDDGTMGDVTANDNIFGICFQVIGQLPSSIPFLVSDAQGRSSIGSIPITPLPTCPPGSGASTTAIYEVTGFATNTPWAFHAGAFCCFDLYVPSVPGVATSGVLSTDETNLRDTFVNAINAACPGLAVALPFNGTSITTYGQFALNPTCGSSANIELAVGPALTPPAGLCVVVLGNTNGCTFNPILTGNAGSGLDCNANGTDDQLEILLGAHDNDHNGVIDSCEYCPANLDDGSGTGTPDAGVDIADLLFFLSKFEAGSTTFADLDNGTGTGTPDHGVDISDLLYFLAHFEGGC